MAIGAGVDPLPLPVLHLALVVPRVELVLVVGLFLPLPLLVVLGGDVGVAVHDVHVDLEVVVLDLVAAALLAGVVPVAVVLPLVPRRRSG